MANTPDESIDVAAMRQPYAGDGLRESDLAPDWTSQFERWLADAVEAGLPEPNAMILATADRDAHPSGRTVLLKYVDELGFTFFTNYESRKGTELAANPYATLVFPWFAMQRQVVVAGRAERVDRAVTEAYFASRPRESQLGAWASPQSRPVASRDALDEALDSAQRRFAGVEEIPAPAHWGGVRLRPESVEFWHGRVGRLHDRLRYRLAGEEWIVERLAP